MEVYGKTNDLCDLDDNRNRHYEGYVPSDIGLGDDGNAITFVYCLDCGQMQGEFPISEEALEEYFEEAESYTNEPIERNGDDRVLLETYERLHNMALYDEEMTRSQMELYLRLSESYGEENVQAS
jgi:hypothetical protein